MSGAPDFVDGGREDGAGYQGFGCDWRGYVVGEADDSERRLLDALAWVGHGTVRSLPYPGALRGI